MVLAEALAEAVAHTAAEPAALQVEALAVALVEARTVAEPAAQYQRQECALSPYSLPGCRIYNRTSYRLGSQTRIYHKT